MKINFTYQAPHKYQKEAQLVQKKLDRINFDKVFGELFPEISKKLEIVVIHRKNLGYEARLNKNKIYLNFSNGWKSVFRSQIHETAHILVREALGKKNQVLSYEVDQTLAILIQAYFENLAKLREFNWKEWENTFDYMNVKKEGKELFPKFTRTFIRNKKPSIINWLDSNEVIQL